MGLPEGRIEELLLHDGFIRGLARRLLADRETAEDVAQDAWVSLLEHTPDVIASLPSWLAGVVRNLARKKRRGEARLRTRQQAVARDEAVPSAEEILEREALRSRLVAAVLELEEPQRSTMLLRYFEGLPPRAIARRQGVPVETVRTRLKRALERLRGRLDRELGDRSTWCALLLPLARRPILPPLIASLAVMTLQTKIAVGVVVLALATLFLLHERSRAIEGPSRAEEQVTSSQSRAQEASATTSTGIETPLPGEQRAPLENEGSPAAPASPELFGSLRLHVVWSDRTPAQGIRARVESRGSGSPGLHALEALTADDGATVFERVPAGRAEIRLDRNVFGKAEVEPGRESSLELEVGRGMDVHGLVVDAFERPVSGADIWSSDFFDFGSGFVVARTHEDGTFEIRSAPTVVCLGARAAGHAPSLRLTLTGTEGGSVSVLLVLPGPGGAIAGTVLDAQGNPVSGAWVLVGKEGTGRLVTQTLASGRSLRGINAAQLVTRTDLAGRFLATGIEPGPVPVAIRAPDVAIWRGEVQVFEGATAQLDAWLTQGVDVVGHTTDSEGRPTVAEVEALEGREPLMDRGPLGSWTFAGPDGEFRFEDLEPGEIQLRAEGEAGRASIQLSGAPGDRLSWEAVLRKAGSLRGRLVDENGTGLANWTLEVMEQTNVEADFQRVSTDGEGRFVAEDFHDRPHRVEVFGPGSWFFPSLVVKDVFPGQSELVLEVESSRFPSVRIVASILGEDGKPVAGVQIQPSCSGYGSVPTLAPELDGHFELGPLPPGTWSLGLRTEGAPSCVLGPKELGANETWDLGEIVLGAEGFRTTK